MAIRGTWCHSRGALRSVDRGFNLIRLQGLEDGRRAPGDVPRKHQRRFAEGQSAPLGVDIEWPAFGVGRQELQDIDVGFAA